MRATTNECRLVAVFADGRSAEQARTDLMQIGFDANDIQLQQRSSGAPEQGSGGFWESLRDFFGMDEAAAYRDATQQGKTILSLRTIDESQCLDRAASTLRRHNPIDIGGCGSEERAPARAATAAAPRAATRQEHVRPGEARESAPARDEETRVPVIEERIDVGKRRELGGGVRVYSRITERPVEADVDLRREHVHVERRPVDQPAGPEAFREGVIEATEMREEPVVTKEARVVEEVVVGKQTEQRREKVRDTVRRQDVEVQRLDEASKKRPEPPAGP